MDIQILLSEMVELYFAGIDIKEIIEAYRPLVKPLLKK